MRILLFGMDGTDDDQCGGQGRWNEMEQLTCICMYVCVNVCASISACMCDIGCMCMCIFMGMDERMDTHGAGRGREGQGTSEEESSVLHIHQACSSTGATI